jgi:hypothetical protein
MARAVISSARDFIRLDFFQNLRSIGLDNSSYRIAAASSQALD